MALAAEVEVRSNLQKNPASLSHEPPCSLYLLRQNQNTNLSHV